MASELHDGPTPNGGAYSVGVYVKLDGLNEVDKADADGIVITEYDQDGKWLHETVGTIAPHAAQRI